MDQALKTISVAIEPSFSTKANKGGRPRKEINQDTFEALCEIQATLEEIAGVSRVSPDTVERWCERTYELGFAECFKKYSAGGKTSLRRQQFELAKKGNPAMLIWLGKQYLNQREPLPPRDEEPVEEISPEELSQVLFSALREAKERAEATQHRRSSHV